MSFQNAEFAPTGTSENYFTNVKTEVNSGSEMYRTYNYEYDYSYLDEYMYPGFAFERPVYLYIWEFLVIVTSLVNIIIISVLLSKKMRNPTNTVFAVIAITDSLTGLVTLPAYIMVYQRFDPFDQYYQTNDYTDNSTDYSYQYNQPSEAGSANTTDYTIHEPVDGYTLTKELCQAFMISKYFLSKSFHTMSIFLTLFLGIQRYIVIAFPYKAQLVMNLKRTVIICLLIVLLSPIMHIYHLTGTKATQGICEWKLEEDGCGPGCTYLWIAFFIRHFIPCVALVAFTVLFIRQLRVGERTLRRMDSSQNQIMRRSDENRRIAITVTVIVIVFLIPEVPFGIFLLYNAIDKSANEGKGIDLETNRAIHMTYELLLVLSFHANFYIYTLINRKFRKILYRKYLKPIRRLIQDPDRLSISRTSSSTHRPSTRATRCTQKCGTLTKQNEIEMESIIATEQQMQDANETNFENELIGQDKGENNTVQQVEINGSRQREIEMESRIVNEHEHGTNIGKEVETNLNDVLVEKDKEIDSTYQNEDVTGDDEALETKEHSSG